MSTHYNSILYHKDNKNKWTKKEDNNLDIIKNLIYSNLSELEYTYSLPTELKNFAQQTNKYTRYEFVCSASENTLLHYLGKEKYQQAKEKVKNIDTWMDTSNAVLVEDKNILDILSKIEEESDKITVIKPIKYRYSGYWFTAESFGKLANKYSQDLSKLTEKKFVINQHKQSLEFLKLSDDEKENVEQECLSVEEELEDVWQKYNTACTLNLAISVFGNNWSDDSSYLFIYNEDATEDID